MASTARTRRRGRRPLAGHYSPRPGRWHRADAHAPADAAPGTDHPAGGPDEHGRRDGLTPTSPTDRLEEPEVPDGPQALLLPHEQHVGRQAGGAVRPEFAWASTRHRPRGRSHLVELAAVKAGGSGSGWPTRPCPWSAASAAQSLSSKPASPREPPRPLLPGPPAARDGHQARHAVRDALSGTPPRRVEGGEQADSRSSSVRL